MIKFVPNTSTNYWEDPIHNLGFEKYSDLGKDCYFFYGNVPHPSYKEICDLPKYYFATEEQLRKNDESISYTDYFDKIFTICSPCAEERPKRESVFFPFNEEFIPTKIEKKVEVIYTGFAFGKHIGDILTTIRKYSYTYVSFHKGGPVTNSNVSYAEKLKLISESKINVIHNLLDNNTPQLKTRPFESAFCKTLMLCYKDDWNVIEEWFEPEKDFIYYTSQEDLENKINQILANYDDYSYIIENAHKKAVSNYTTKHFVEKYLK